MVTATTRWILRGVIALAVIATLVLGFMLRNGQFSQPLVVLGLGILSALLGLADMYVGKKLKGQAAATEDIFK